MASRMIEVTYNCKGELGLSWVSGSQRFTDWYDFADWLKQQNETKGAVLISEWRYV